MKLLTIILSTVLSSSVFAAELNGVKMDETTKVGEKELVLNGMGLRKVHRFGIPVKVYVGGLYLEAKSTDSDAILASEGVKQVVMEFVRSVDRKSLVNAYKEGYEKNCQIECDKKELFTDVKKLVVGVRKKNRVIFTFEKDQMTMESTGPNAKKGTVKSTAVSKNMLAIFINKKAPPTKEFRAGLLGSK